MRRQKLPKAKIISITSIALLLIIYILFNFRIFISGPQIEIIDPQSGSSFEDPFIVIRGKVKNISFLSIDDSPIFVDENGNFGQKLLLSPGLSIIELYARDKFEREVTEILEYVYNGTLTEIDLNELDSIEIIVSTSTEENIATSTSTF
ncbi:MAG: hypothetical protein ACI9GH_000125 [Candidatus Paceibacteria bacterium]|jgi:hypothetical protein